MNPAETKTQREEIEMSSFWRFLRENNKLPVVVEAMDKSRLFPKVVLK